jgi:hypothetical protein
VIRINIPRDITADLMQVAKDRADKLAFDIVGDLLAETPVDTGQAKNGWTMDDSGDVITIENRIPYIERLNQGHSKQAPAGFVEEIIDYRTR